MKYVYLLYYEFKRGIDQDTILVGAYDSEEKVRLAQMKKEREIDSPYVIYFWESIGVC